MIIRAKPTTITRTRLALAVLSIALTLGASAACARPQVSLHADGAAVALEASDAPLAEVLSALEGAYAIRYRTSVALDQPVSGAYHGPLRHVLSRLLDGYDYYVADAADGSMDITVVGRPGPRVAAPQVTTVFQRVEVPPPTVADVAAERERAHHRRPPPKP